MIAIAGQPRARCLLPFAVLRVEHPLTARFCLETRLMPGIVSRLCCKPRHPYLVIANAIVWAALIVAASYFIAPGASGNSFVLAGLLVAGWFGVHALLQSR